VQETSGSSVLRKEGATRVVCDREFRPLVAYVGGPLGRQALAPAAEVRLTHDHPDDYARGGELPLLVDRHLDPLTELPLGVPVTRETPAEDVKREGPYLSLAARPPEPDGDPVGGELYAPDQAEPPHAREWDFLKEHARKALAAAGVPNSTDPVEKVQAFAEYAMNFKKSPTYGSFHPVDVLLHSSYCTGAANVFAALCCVEGIATRQTCISNHTMNEVCLDGRWHFVDNHADGARFMPGRDYVDVTLDCDRHDELGPKQRDYLGHPRTWARSPWHYSGTLRWHWAWGDGQGRGIRTDVMDGYGVGVPCDPHHARALYPGRDRHPFPLWNGTPEIILTEKASWLRVNLLLEAGEALLKPFHVGPSDDNPVKAACVEWWFRGEVSREDVVLTCDEDLELEPAALLPGTGGVTVVRFDLPVDAVAEIGPHALVLTNRSDRRLSAVAYPTPLVTPPPVGTQGALKAHPQSLMTEPIII